ncbi:hypothetical protein GFY24_00780 [Nocardia sp. SYP-A9097]|uniref:hypothetical protein n=1 Tax=Nocardia sp. SYP-A9097 TaxID=2663237 RepID=UPI00129B0492|nr:hypothetical protein [Nocardia sp. SYP-A9097]MRH86012.1 hypothetical protein [Nocardia sp. SYP-A9097]
MDTGVYQVAHTLIGALTAALASTRAGAPCVSVVHPGTSTPMYGWCKCEDNAEGMAWTRVVSIAPTIRFPQPISGVAAPGEVVQLAAVIELGVDRCYWSTEDNSMPPIEILDSMARDIADDAAAMMRAVQCAGLPQDVVLGSWMPRGPSGGIHGGTMTVTVRVDSCAPCTSVMTPLDEVVAMLPGDPRAS